MDSAPLSADDAVHLKLIDGSKYESAPPPSPRLCLFKCKFINPFAPFHDLCHVLPPPPSSLSITY